MTEFPESGRGWEIVGTILLVTMTAVAYIPAIRGGYVWDDRLYVWSNPLLGSVKGLRDIWFVPSSTPMYCPLVFTTFWLEHHLWDVMATGYHIVNVALHIVNAWLVWRILRRLSVAGGFLAAAIFALHPVHVQSVAWISERKDVLSALFYLLTVLVWLRFVETRQWWRYGLAVVLFACAMLSKPIACTLPLVLLLVAWWKEPATWQREIRPVLGLLAVAIPLAILTMWRLDEPDLIAGQWTLSPLGKVLVAGRAVWFYVWKLLWPVNLMTFYPIWNIDVLAAWQYAFPIAVLSVLGALWWWRSRIGAAPLLAVLYFVITLGPVLGFVSFAYSGYVFDHFLYLPCLGLMALFSALLIRATARFGAPRPRVVAVIAAPLLLALGVLTWRQAAMYRDIDTFWRVNLEKNADALMPNYNVGTTMLEQDRVDEAAVYFENALRAAPTHAPSHVNLAYVLDRQGNSEQARVHYAEAVRLAPGNVLARDNLGMLLVKQGKLDEAIEQFAQEARLRPNDPAGHVNWGIALALQGKLDEAVQHYSLAVQIAPNHAAAHYNWGQALEAQGKLDEAIEQYSVAVQLKPERADLRESLQRAIARRQAPEQTTDTQTTNNRHSDDR